MSEGMNLVFIYGPPGVGKLTVAQELARETGYKVFHNHVSIDCAEAVFDFGTKPFGSVIGKIRLAVFEEAAREGVSLVFTLSSVIKTLLSEGCRTRSVRASARCPRPRSCARSRRATTSSRPCPDA